MSMEEMNRAPLSSSKAEDFDAKGTPRKNHEMVEGDVFFGSDEEYAEEVGNRREQAKS